MKPLKPQLSTPFWKDEPNLPSSYVTMKASNLLSKVIGVVFSFSMLCISFAIFYPISPILAWFWLITLAISIGLGFRFRRRRKLEIHEITQIQFRALEQTGASSIGSAIHVAGHPSLGREQSIVLAMIAPNLAIYSYESNQPIILIPLQQIIAVHTVVYDDERIPHIDVVDSTAQALQITLKFGDREITCLFRRMKKVRPIDWYHIIQKSRIQ